jgi:hypothetical protein
LKGEISNLETVLSERKKQIEELKGLITSKEAEINLKNDLEKRNSEIISLMAVLLQNNSQ